MKIGRRDLLVSALAGAALGPVSAAAQPGLPKIGYFSTRSPEAETPLQAGVLAGLKKAGFVVGRNIAIEYRYGEGSLERLPSLAAELIRLPAAVLVATDANAAIAAKKGVSDDPNRVHCRLRPGAIGLVASIGRPAGNATGVYVFQQSSGRSACKYFANSFSGPA